VLIQPKTGEDFNNKRNIDYWDPTNEARILKAVSIITFGIVGRILFYLLGEKCRREKLPKNE
jgi:hypothetical protein